MRGAPHHEPSRAACSQISYSEHRYTTHTKPVLCVSSCINPPINQRQEPRQNKKLASLARLSYPVSLAQGQVSPKPTFCQCRACPCNSARQNARLTRQNNTHTHARAPALARSQDRCRHFRFASNTRSELEALCVSPGLESQTPSPT